MANRQTFTQQDIDSFHWLKFPGQNGEFLFALSGIIKIDMKGASQNWLGNRVTCTINIPDLPAGMGLYIRYHTPFAALNSIYNQNLSNNSGHSVNSANLVNIHPVGNFGVKEITLALDLAVRDNDAYLYRVGFNVLLTGFLRPLPPVDPCLDEQNALNRLESLCNGGYQAQIDALQDLLPDAPPPQKADIIRAIRELQEKLNSCPTDLTSARKALNVCRLTNTPQDLPVGQ